MGPLVESRIAVLDLCAGVHDRPDFILTRWIFPSSLSWCARPVLVFPVLLRSWHDLSYLRPGGFIAETSDDVVLGLFLGLLAKVRGEGFL